MLKISLQFLVAVRHLQERITVRRAYSNMLVFMVCITCVHAANSAREAVLKLNQDGVKKMDSSKLRDAIGDFNEALKIQPAYKLAYRNRLICYRRLKDYTSMIADFEKLQRDSPLASIGLEWIGDAYADQGKHRQKLKDIVGALESYEHAYLCWPELSEYRFYPRVARQTVDTKVGQKDSELEKAVLLNNAGATKLLSSDFAGAVSYFNKALKIKPGYAIADRNRFLAYHKMKAYSAVISHFDAAKKSPSFDPNSYYLPFVGDAYAGLGLQLQKSGDAAGALESFQKANFYSPGMAEYLHYRGIAKQATGDVKGANMDFETEKQSFSLKSRD